LFLEIFVCMLIVLIFCQSLRHYRNI
jgi:hypothetical protein